MKEQNGGPGLTVCELCRGGWGHKNRQIGFNTLKKCVKLKIQPVEISSRTGHDVLDGQVRYTDSSVDWDGV